METNSDMSDYEFTIYKSHSRNLDVLLPVDEAYYGKAVIKADNVLKKDNHRILVWDCANNIFANRNYNSINGHCNGYAGYLRYCDNNGASTDCMASRFNDNIPNILDPAATDLCLCK